VTDRNLSAVLFDLDDTLCEYRRSSAEILRIAFDHEGVHPFFDENDYRSRYPEFVDGSETVDELRRGCFAAIAREAGVDPVVGERVADRFATERDHGDVRLLPGARAAIDRLGQEYRLGLVTNGAPEMQRTKLAGVGLESAFDTIVFAGYDTPGKPDPTPFFRALEQLGVPASEAVHVGNSVGSDVAGARAAGVGAVWLPDGTHRGQPDPAPDHQLDSLTELLEPPWVSDVALS
jgi:putative hydrolase of the HAD superfamily